MTRIKLSDERYEYIKKIVVKTLKECNIKEVPIDPFLICKRRGYKLIKYTEKYDKEKMKLVCSRFPNGFRYFKNGEYVIEYNDIQPKERIRTTIFHEIGHIELKHTCPCTLAETEAEWFGVYMIAPPPVVNLLGVENSEELMFIFGTSEECGFYSMNRYIRWKNRAWILKDYEEELVNLFRNNNELLIQKGVVQ